MVIKLSGRVSFDERGNVVPHFLTLKHVQETFSDEEITELVNRSLYQILYQQATHLKRAANRAEQLKPIREYLRRHFNVTLDKATDEQIQEAKRKCNE
jgi:hypothetical protein